MGTVYGTVLDVGHSVGHNAGPGHGGGCWAVLSAGHNYIGHNYIGHNYTGHNYSAWRRISKTERITMSPSNTLSTSETYLSVNPVF